MNRRDVLKLGLAAGAAALGPREATAAPEHRARVVAIKSEDRRDAVRRALRLLGAGASSASTR